MTTPPRLRTCPHCKLVFESDGLCPACHKDPDKPPADDTRHDRRKTTEVPRIPKQR